MKNNSGRANAQLTALDIFNELVTTTTKSTRCAEVQRTVNGVDYFQSKYSGRFFKESDRCGDHRYSKQDIGVWNQIYAALKPLKKRYDELLVEGRKDEADAIFTAKHQVLWNAKDNDATLYANTGGFTSEELDALEQQ